MNSLNNYRKLSDEDKRDLTDYIIYRSIEDNCNEKSMTLSDNEIIDIKEVALDFYLDDCSGDLSVSRITDFITINYLDNNITLEELNEVDRQDLYEAIYEDCIEMIKNDELER